MSRTRYTVTRSMVLGDLDFFIVDWRERMIDAINQVPAPSIGSSQGPKAAVWLAFGHDAANMLFPQFAGRHIPGSLPAQVVAAALKRFSLPVWAAVQIEGLISGYYAQKLQQNNAALFQNYLLIRDKFVEQVQHVARNFIGTAFAGEVTEAVVASFRGEGFASERAARIAARKRIHRAGLVETRPSVIREQVRSGVAKVVERVGLIYRGSPEASTLYRPTRLMYAANDTLYWKQPFDRQAPARQGYNYRRVRSQADALWIMAHAHQMEVHHFEPAFVTADRIPTTYVVRKFADRQPRDFVQIYDQVRQALGTSAGAPRSAVEDHAAPL